MLIRYSFSVCFRPVYDKGQHTLQVPMSMFADNRARLLARLKKLAGVTGSSVVLLQGGDTHNVYCTDAEDVFRQVSHHLNLISSFTPAFHTYLQLKKMHICRELLSKYNYNQRSAACTLFVNKQINGNQCALSLDIIGAVLGIEEGGWECHCTDRKLICKHAH